MKASTWAFVTGSLLVGGFLSFAAARAASLEWKDPAPALQLPPIDGVRPPWGESHVGLDILVDGRPLPTICYGGRIYLAVPAWGTEYAIRVWNRGPRRVEAIVSVDGLSVIDGRPASEAWRGYLVDASDEIVIPGWRRDRDTVAAFTFEERDRSYASRIGRPENIGVIGLVAFDEATVSPPLALEKADSAAPAARRGYGDLDGTGTGYGRDVNSHVDYVPFVRGGGRRTITLYYDTAEALRRAGVPVPAPLPIPFPADSEFTPPPPGDPRK